MSAWSWTTPPRPKADLVSIMTLHGAKGLEFDNVFLAGWEEGLFPNQRADRRGRHQGARGGAAAGLCRHHPRPAAPDGELRRQPARLQSMVLQRALAVRRRVAARASRAPASQPGDPARPRHLPRRRAVHGPPDQPVPLPPGGARQADRGQGGDPAVAATGPDRRRSSPATGSSTTSSATGTSSRSRATSWTSPSRIPGRKKVIDSFVQPA